MATAGGLEIHVQMAHTGAEPGRTGAEPGRIDPGRAASLPPPIPDRPAPSVYDLPAPAAPSAAGRFAQAAPLAIVIVILLLAGVVTAVRRSGETVTPLDAVRASATRTVETNTAAVTIKVEAPGLLSAGLTYGGAMDFANNRARFDVDPSSFGVPGFNQKIQALYDFNAAGAVVYMHIPQLAGELGGKEWMKLDMQKLFQAAGLKVDVNQLVQARSNDPTSGLRLLEGASQVTKLGAEQVRGVDTTHYALIVDLDKAVTAAPPASQEALRQLLSLYKVRTLPLEVWLDVD
jgi:hypothetical protein